MSQSEVERFARDAQADAALRKEVGMADRLEATVGIAARRGYAFTVDELATLVRARGEAAGTELSETSLDAVAGGGGAWNAQQQQEALIYILHGRQPPSNLPG
jgi:predicted ribosomally synthesized peptide with nif11-like leader